MVNFPAPIGGTVLPSDFAPSILFAVLYGLLLPLFTYRMYARRSRTLVLLGSGFLLIERIVFYGLRASQAHNDSKRFSGSLVTYMQVSYGLSYINIANDSIAYIRCLLVNPTFGSDNYKDSPAGHTKGGVCKPPPEGTPDQPRLRSWFRRLTGLLRVIFLASIIPAIVANTHYSNIFGNQSKADQTASLRYASAAVALAMCFVLIGIIAWSVFKYPARSVSRRSAGIASLIIALMMVIAIYRLAVMHVRTTSLAEPTPLDTPAGKAEFYVFHVLPEWSVLCLLYMINVRKTFSTGFAGDWRARDKKEEADEEMKNLAGNKNPQEG
ncbi:hypothetical protein CPC08DRAFT_757736 [Agrocybe pediades]|nr:hypothetical protein CPC08DRAFT_757736 [Agrocybe pediades]